MSYDEEVTIPTWDKDRNERVRVTVLEDRLYLIGDSIAGHSTMQLTPGTAREISEMLLQAADKLEGVE